MHVTAPEGTALPDDVAARIEQIKQQWDENERIVTNLKKERGELSAHLNELYGVKHSLEQEIENLKTSVANLEQRGVEVSAAHAQIMADSKNILNKNEELTRAAETQKLLLDRRAAELDLVRSNLDRQQESFNAATEALKVAQAAHAERVEKLRKALE